MRRPSSNHGTLRLPNDDGGDDDVINCWVYLPSNLLTMPTNFDMDLRHKVVFTNKAVLRWLSDSRNPRLSRRFDALENVAVTSVCARGSPLSTCCPPVLYTTMSRNK